MKRKVIQIGNSTQLISIPRSWGKRFNIKRGEELEVEEENHRLIVSTDRAVAHPATELDISTLGIMIPRCIYALYKRGVDEIRLTFDNPSLIKQVQESIQKETVGFEIIEQGKNYCIIKNVSGQFEEFEPILRRTFLLLLSMSEDTLASLEKKDYEHLHTVAYLEEANNRFTTACRRFLNRQAYKESSKIGPLYYIIEDLEKLADEYKYLCMYFYDRKNEKETGISKKTLEIFRQVHTLLRDFYEIFYKFDAQKIAVIAVARKKQVSSIISALENAETKYDRVTLHHLLTITQKIFNYVGPYLVMELK